MKKLFSLAFAAIASLAFSAGAMAQTIQPQTTLDSQVWFSGSTVDIEHARIIDITPGAHKITDALGVVHTGYFANVNAFTLSPIFKKYIRAYNGSNIFYNASMFTKPDCVNGQTVLPWITGGMTYVQDSCSLKQQILQYARTN